MISRSFKPEVEYNIRRPTPGVRLPVDWSRVGSSQENMEQTPIISAWRDKQFRITPSLIWLEMSNKMDPNWAQSIRI